MSVLSRVLRSVYNSPEGERARERERRDGMSRREGERGRNVVME